VRGYEEAFKEQERRNKPVKTSNDGGVNKVRNL